MPADNYDGLHDAIVDERRNGPEVAF